MFMEFGSENRARQEPVMQETLLGSRGALWMLIVTSKTRCKGFRLA